MKSVADISITSRFLQARGPVTPVVITATVSPTLGSMRDGESVQAALSPGALDTGSYASTAGAITTVSATVTINGAAGALTDVVGFDDVVRVSITVSDEAGNTRDFNAGTQTVQGIAPTLTAGDSLSGRTLTITVDSTTGVPAPDIVLTALTLDDGDVLGDETGSGPWTYEVPDSADGQTVAWTIEASNVAGSDTASGSEPVAANLFAPTITAAPQITGDPVPGETVTITNATATGTPTPTVDSTLALGSTDVTGDMAGGAYEIPPGTSIGTTLTLTSVASNGISPDAQDSVSVTVEDASSFLLETYPGAVHAYSLRQLSSSITNVVQVRRSSDDAVRDFTETEISDGTLVGWVGAGAGDNGLVKTWYDQSGNGRHAASNATTQEPAIVIDGVLQVVNGEPVAQHDGIDDHLIAPSAGFISNLELFAVFGTLDPVDGSTTPIATWANINSFIIDGQDSDTLPNRGFRFIASESTGVSDYPPGTDAIVVAGQDATEVFFSINGNLRTVPISGPMLQGTEVTIGARSGGNSKDKSSRLFFKEAILYDTDQSAVRSDIEQDQADHYGVML